MRTSTYSDPESRVGRPYNSQRTIKADGPTQPSTKGGVLHWLAVISTAFVTLPYVVYAALSHNGLLRDQQICLLLLSAASFVCSLLAMCQSSPIPRCPKDHQRGTWFGHLMSMEGEWNHIPVVLCATYSFVLCYGAVASLIAGCALLCMPSFYIMGMPIFYLWHWAAHVWEGSELNLIHMHHHQARYPQHDFYGDEHPAVQRERAARRGRPASLWALMNPATSATTKLAHDGPLLLGGVAVLLLARVVFEQSVLTCAFIFAGFAFMGIFGSAVHMSYHERNFDWEPYAWYRELRSLHMIHHMHRKNFAMVNVILDLVFCSLMLEG